MLTHPAWGQVNYMYNIKDLETNHINYHTRAQVSTSPHPLLLAPPLLLLPSPQAPKEPNS